MKTLFFFKKRTAFFYLWILIYSSIAIYVFHTRQGFTKDELYYLEFADLEGFAFSYFLSDSIHFVQPMVVSLWVRLTNDLPIYILNLPVFFLACKFLINSSKLRPTLFLIMLIPTAHYCGTYLREPLLFSMVFLFLGCVLRNYNRLSVLVALLIFPIRFYWSAAAIGFLTINKNIRLSPYFFLLAILLMIFFQGQLIYLWNSLMLIQLDLKEFVRVFFIPLPTFSFSADVNLYENAFLYSIIFPIKILLSLFFLYHIIMSLFGVKINREVKLVLFFSIILLSTTAFTSLVGPRQVILGQSLLALAIFGKYKFIWRAA